MNPDTIQALKDNPYFPEFEAYIENKISELSSFDGLTQLPDERAGQEVKVRALAVEQLKKILLPFLSFQEKREPTIEEVQQAKNKVGF